MNRILLVLAFLLCASSAEATVRYASNTGTGASPCTTNSSAAAMCNVVTASTAAVAGDTIKLLGNTMQSPAVYQGANYMLVPPVGKSGTSGSEITIKCSDSSGSDNEGACLIDGQFVRRPLLFTTNAWWIIEGINFRNSSRSGISFTTNSSHVTVRRVVVWDANAAYNASTVSVTSSDVTMEDVAAFGIGRYVFSGAQGSDNFTCRRCWARWEGSLNVGPKLGYQLTYNGYGFTCENCLATWSAEMIPTTHTVLNNGIVWDQDSVTAGVQSLRVNGIQNPVALYRSHGEDGTDKCANMKVLGSIGYLGQLAASRGPLVLMSINVSNSTYAADCNTISHTLLAHNPLNDTFNTIPAFDLNQGTTTLTQSTADHITSVIGTVGDSLGSQWTVSNRSTGTTVASVPNPWTNVGSGARICFKTTNGITGTTPLWPWPMNERIKQATGYSGNYWNNGGPGCSASLGNCVGTPTTNRAATDVTADIESLFGTIPAECRTDSQVPPFSNFPGYPTTAVISTFSGGPVAPPTGFSTVNGNGWTESGGVARPTTTDRKSVV